jgi:hypothetical protein
MSWVRFVRVAGFGVGLAAVLGLGGCAALSGGEARVLAAGQVGPKFAVPTARERMVHLARQEWAVFGRPVVNDEVEPAVLVFPEGVGRAHESLPAFFSRVFLYWYAVTDEPLLGYEGEIRPWSGAFVSWLARSAGVAESDLPSSVLHWDYMQFVLAAGNTGRFVGHAVDAYAPGPGDLLCAPRGEEFARSIKGLADLRRGPFHCEVVVAQRPGELDVIGGNVLDAVSMTHVAVDGSGLVLPTRGRPWVLVIEQRD